MGHWCLAGMIATPSVVMQGLMDLDTHPFPPAVW